MVAFSASSDTQALVQFARMFRAYMECSDELQQSAVAMINAIVDPESDEDDRVLAQMTLADILFPNPHNGLQGTDLVECEAIGAEDEEETRAELERMDRQEATFAERLRAEMKAKDITQVELAEKIGVGQSAIAMMLARECRPQRRTIRRLANALGVSCESLWPGYAD